ncbi:MAG: echA8 [Phycisphaerales bacterium]|nr:echA8 [Phycisphaerales bacterium]
MSDSMVLVQTVNPAVAAITFNRPDKRNALSLALIEQITQAVVAAGVDPARRVIILGGSGPSFCAGLDLSEASEPGDAGRSAEALAKMYAAIGNSPLVTIAAAQGAAMGGGAGILAACDFVVAADDLKIAYPEVRRGLVAALVTCLLRRQINDRAVRELILLGENIPAARALGMGLVSQIVPASSLMDSAMDLARRACQGAPGAIARTKRLLDDLAARPLAEDLRQALAYHLEARHSGEAAEGIAAFREKREPRWGPRPGA